MDKLLDKLQFYYSSITQNAPGFFIGLVVLFVGFTLANFGKKVAQNKIKSKGINSLSVLFIFSNYSCCH